MKQGRVNWYYNTLTPKMAIFTVLMEQAIEEIAEEVAKELEDYAKENAPWDDRTGSARGGLTADVTSSGNKLIIALYHTVDYGIWLEVRWNGKYAIIQPTIERYGPILMGALGSSYGVME